MMHEKFLRLFLILLIIFGSMIWGQFVEVNVGLDMRRLSEGDRQLFNTMTEEIKNYFLATQFSSEVRDLEIIIDIHLVLESVDRGGSQTTINAQAILVNKEVQSDGSMKTMDQYYYAKGIQFPYSRGWKMYYTTIFDPLASFLDYYAFMFIATELDTWNYMGGATFFHRAVEIASLGKDSDWPTGWDDRWKKSRKIKNNQYLRSMRFNYFTALDAMSSEEVDFKIVQAYMESFYEDLKTIDKKLGINRETLRFLNAYHENIANLLAENQLKDGLELLIHYDNDNKKVYESFLKN